MRCIGCIAQGRERLLSRRHPPPRHFPAVGSAVGRGSGFWRCEFISRFGLMSSFRPMNRCPHSIFFQSPPDDSQSVLHTHLLAWRTGPHAHTRCTRLAREPTRGTLSPALAPGPDCWTHSTQLTGQLTRWRYIVGFSGTDTGEEGGAQGRGHRTHELISHPAPGAVARASAGVFGPAVWQAPGHRSAGRAFKPHPRSAPALRRDPARC